MFKEIIYKYYSVLLTIEFSVFSNVNLPHNKNNMIQVSRIFIVSTDWLVGDMNPYKFATVSMEIQVSQ